MPWPCWLAFASLALALLALALLALALLALALLTLALLALALLPLASLALPLLAVTLLALGGLEVLRAWKFQALLSIWVDQKVVSTLFPKLSIFLRMTLFFK